LSDAIQLVDGIQDGDALGYAMHACRHAAIEPASHGRIVLSSNQLEEATRSFKWDVAHTHVLLLCAAAAAAAAAGPVTAC
jgi:hypothetical protein